MLHKLIIFLVAPSFAGNYSVKINLEDFDGHQRYAEYKNFQVANEKVQVLKVDEIHYVCGCLKIKRNIYFLKKNRLSNIIS